MQSLPSRKGERLRSLCVHSIRLSIVAGCLAVSMSASAQEFPLVGQKLVWQNRATAFCLGVAGATMKAETPIIAWPCNGNPDQTWTVLEYDGVHYFYNEADSTQVLSVQKYKGDHGAKMVITDIPWIFIDGDGGWSDQWYIAPGRVQGCYTVQSSLSGLYMGVAGQSTSRGAAVIDWEWLAHTDQEWCPAAPPGN